MKTFKKNLKLILLGIGLVLVASYAQASWSAPASVPSSYTSDAPIHTGTGAQTKLGGLGISSAFSAFKDASLNQSTIITGSLDGDTSTHIVSIGGATNKVMLNATGDISATEYLKDAGVAKSTNDGKTSTLCADAVGKIILCQAPLAKVSGVCGSSNGQTGILLPTTGLCTSGTPSIVTGNGDWVWSCNGSNGGANAACSANNIIPIVATQLLPKTTENNDYNENYKFVFTKPTPAPLKVLIGETYTGAGCFYDVAYGWQLFPDLPKLTHTVGTSISAAYGASSYPLYIEVPAGVTTFKSNIGADHVYGSSNIKVYNMDTKQILRVGWGWYGKYFNCQHTRDTFFKLIDEGYRANFTSTNTIGHTVN